MTRLKTELAESIYLANRGKMRNFLQGVDGDPTGHPNELLGALRKAISSARVLHSDGPDSLFDDLYVIDRYIDFLNRYSVFWRQLVELRFSSSWSALQDALDLLRLVRKFSAIDISCFENQLLEVEKTYPYGIFVSIGASVEKFECSICGSDIDSTACVHRKGHLYRGKMAYGIARNLTTFDHVALVDQPEDKRCVVSYEDTGPQFKLVRYVAQLIVSRTMRISQFGQLVFSKRRIPNPQYQKLGRNVPCYCGSGHKFKLCCIGEEYTEGDHVDIVPRPFSVEQAVV